MTSDTPRTKIVLAFADNRSFNFNGLTLRPGTTQLGWETLSATLVRGEVFTNDCTALIIASGWWENTGQVWTDTNKVSVGNQWGRSPVLTEVVPFTLSLPVGTNHVSVWALDERGQRKLAVPVTGTSASSSINVGTNTGSIWYELRVSRWMTSFDLWRTRYFTEGELADLAVSGEAAAPDGDRVVNLWKYYLGLPGKTPAPSDRLPNQRLWSVTNQSFLSVSYLCDRLADDVTFLAQVSPDLANWFSGPGYTQVEQSIDQGDFRSLTIRDLVPVSASAQRFLRLQLQKRCGLARPMLWRQGCFKKVW